MSFASMMVQVDVTGELSGRVRVAAQLADRFKSHLIGISSWMLAGRIRCPCRTRRPSWNCFRNI